MPLKKYAETIEKDFSFWLNRNQRREIERLIYEIEINNKLPLKKIIAFLKEKLNDKEWKAIKTHPKLGADIIGHIRELVPCVDIVLYHHEWWNGDGYPEGLQGEKIPIEARIIAIANTFDVMITAQSYRPAFSLEETTKELRKGARSQFDPQLVGAFIRIVETQPWR